MFSEKIFGIFMFLCINLNKLNVFADLSKLQDVIDNKLTIETKADSTNNIHKISVFKNESVIYAHLVESTDPEVIKLMKLKIFYIFINCLFAVWIQNKLLEFIRNFPLLCTPRCVNKFNLIFFDEPNSICRFYNDNRSRQTLHKYFSYQFYTFFRFNRL